MGIGKFIVGVGVAMVIGLSTATMLSEPAPAAEVPAGNPDRGMVIFSTYCASCHGEDGRGDGPMAARLVRDLGVAPADLASAAFQQRSSDGSISKAIREGGVSVHRSPYMPAWGLTLTEGQIADLVAFVRELGEAVPNQPPKASMVDIQTALELGRTLYGLNCAACHGPSGKGDGPTLEAVKGAKKPPDLSDPVFYDTRSDRMLAEWIQSGLDHSGILKSKSGWWHRPLEPNEVRALTFYLRSLPLTRPEAAPPPTR